MASASEVDAALTDLARQHSGRVLAILASRFGSVDLADDAVQDALVRAHDRWPRDGVPDNPPAWLMTVARRRAVDLLRRAESAERRLLASAPELMSENTEAPDPNPLVDDSHDDAAFDEQLRLMLLCCHPAIRRESQVALTLRLVGGLTTEEIAAAFLLPTPTLAQRISRAKAKIRGAAIPLAMPSDIDSRIEVVLSTLYLIFNEGYLSRSETSAARLDLCLEAMRLTGLLRLFVPDNPEVVGLHALMAFHLARRATRFSTDDELILLEDQDRTRWDLEQIGTANSYLRKAFAFREPGRYQIQALIASYHANARTSADTDWVRIVALYEQLVAMDRSPVVALNHAAAVAMADGPMAGLALVDQIEGLEEYYLWYSTRAELLHRAGCADDAVAAWRKAAALVINPAERRLIEQRIASADR